MMDTMGPGRNTEKRHRDHWVCREAEQIGDEKVGIGEKNE